MGRPARAKPIELYPNWPFAAVKTNQVHEKFRRFVFELWGICQEEYSGVVSLMERETGTRASTLGPILRGKVWPDSETVARLEVELDRPLWPRHSTHQKGPEAPEGT